MAALTSILSTDLISASRATINTNFGNLYSSIQGVNTSVLTVSSALGVSLPSVLSMQPGPPNGGFFNTAAVTFASSVTGYVGLYNTPAGIQFNSFSLSVSSVRVGGPLSVGFYTEDGQTRMSSLVTATYSTNGVKTESVSSVVLRPGNFYTVVVPTGGTNVDVRGIALTSTGTISSVVGKPVFSGNLSVSAGTLPPSFVPSTVSLGNPSCITFRLDQ